MPGWSNDHKGSAMRSPGKITRVEYDDNSMRLRVEFDTQRVVIFHMVERSLGESLLDCRTRDRRLAALIIGKFAWTERGVPAY
jgi:hypothetical protein